MTPEEVVTLLRRLVTVEVGPRRYPASPGARTDVSHEITVDSELTPHRVLAAVDWNLELLVNVQSLVRHDGADSFCQEQENTERRAEQGLMAESRRWLEIDRAVTSAILTLLDSRLEAPPSEPTQTELDGPPD